MTVLDNPSRRNVLGLASATVCALFLRARAASASFQTSDRIDASQSGTSRRDRTEVERGVHSLWCGEGGH